MSGLLKPRTTTNEMGSTSTCTQLAIVKKYSCMYTSDVQKHRKVWHDGFLRIRHLNSKVDLISEEGHSLAQSFLKSSLINRAGACATTTTKRDLDDSLSYMKVPAEFELDEDQQIEFDPVEDSESRPCPYVARVVTLLKIETENVPLMTPLNSKAKQELHKRKMEILDQTILQLSKRPKTTPHVMSSPFAGSISPSTPVPSSSRRKLAAGFETRPFNSPLLTMSKSSKTMMEQPMLDSLLTPIKPSQSVEELGIQPSDMKPVHHHQKLKNSPMKSIIRKPILEPIHASFSNPDPTKSSYKSEEKIQSTTNLRLNKSKNSTKEACDRVNEHPASTHESNTKNSPPDLSPSNRIERISSKKTLKIDWNSYFQPAKPTP